MDEGDAAGVGGKGAGQRGVGVAVHDDHLGRVDVEVLLEAQRGVTDLGAPAPATDLEAQRRRTEAELPQELTAQVVVEVLAGVDHPAPVAQQLEQRHHLDHLGTGPEDDRDAPLSQ